MNKQITYLQAIETKFLQPSRNLLVARLKATTASGISITVPASSDLTSVENHRRAAEVLCDKMEWSKWKDSMVGGASRRGYVFVFHPEA